MTRACARSCWISIRPAARPPAVSNWPTTSTRCAASSPCTRPRTTLRCRRLMRLRARPARYFVTRTGAVGSVGVYALHVDQSGFDKELGAKYTYVFAGEKKVDGNPHRAAGRTRARADIQDEVDREYGIFTETVARNRKAATKQIVATQAGCCGQTTPCRCWPTQVGTFDDAMNALAGRLGGAQREFNGGGSRNSQRKENQQWHEDVQGRSPRRRTARPRKRRPKKKPDEAEPKMDAKPPADDDEDDDDDRGQTQRRQARRKLPLRGA